MSNSMGADIKGAIITIDAMGTQTEIVRLIHHKEADYVLALKSNHPTLHSQVKKWFDTAVAKNFEGITVSIGLAKPALRERRRRSES